MLFFIKVEKNRMIPITSMEPMNAPIMTDRNPDKVNTPAVIVPAPASMTKATPKLAPELIPSMEGSAKGLLNVVCNISPDAASAIPQRRAVIYPSLPPIRYQDISRRQCWSHHRFPSGGMQTEPSL